MTLKSHTPTQRGCLRTDTLIYLSFANFIGKKKLLILFQVHVHNATKMPLAPLNTHSRISTPKGPYLFHLVLSVAL